MTPNTLKTILLVEDEAIIAMSQKLTLEKHDYRVTLCHTGEDAIRAVTDDSKIDLILMDIDLGAGIDGTEAAQIILSEHDLPLIFFSSHTEREIVEKTEGITSYGYIVKNSGETVMLASIKMAFRLFDARRREKEKEASLIKSEEKHRTLITQMQSALALHEIILDEKGRPRDYRFLEINNGFEKLTGLKREDVLNRTVLEVLPETEPYWIEQYGKVALTGEPLQYENYSRALNRHYSVVAYSPQKQQFATIFHDITESKRAQQRLQAEKARLAVTLKSIGDAVIATDTTGDITLLNTIAQNMTGWNEEEAIGQPLTQVFHIINSATRKIADNPVARALKQGCIVGLANHTVLISKDGREYQIADSAAPIFDQDNVIIGVILVFRDVTAEYVIQKQIRENARGMKRGQAMAHLGSWLINLDNNTVSASDEALTIYGLDTTELTLKTIQDIPLPQYRALLDDAMKHMIEDHIPYDIEFEIRRPSDQAIRYIHSICEYDAEENRIVGSIQDITKQKQMETALQKEHRLRESIMDTSPVAIVTVDTSGQITYANRTAESTLGLTKKKITARTYNAPAWELSYPDGHPYPVEEMPFSIVKKTKQPVYGILQRITWPNGRHILLSVNGSPLFDEKGEFSGVVASMQDITDQEKNTKNIKQLLTEKETLLKETHHRVKNNMAVVKNLIAIQRAGQPDPLVNKLLKNTEQRIQNMAILYEKLYRSQNRDAYTLETFLPPLVNEILSVYDAPVPIETRFLLEGANDIALHPGTLSPIGILLNELLTNSIKHAFSGRKSGLITIEANRILIDQIGEKTEGEGIALVYADDGCGIPNDVLEDGHGGFGLQLLKMLTRQINGTLTITGNKGTRITICFPI